MLEARQRWYRPAVAVGGAALGVVGAAAAVASPRPDPLSFVATAIIPPVCAVAMVGGAWRWPRLLLVAIALLDIEAAISGYVFINGASLALLLPFIGLGLLHPSPNARAVRVAYAVAGIATLTGAMLAVFAGPTHGLPAVYPAPIALGFFLTAATLALAFNWRLSGRLVEAVAVATNELAVRESTEGELRRTTQRLEAVVAAAPLAIVLTDRDGMIRGWNREAARIYGASADAAIGRHVADVTEMAADQYAEFRQRIDAGESIAGLPVSRRQADGRQLELRVFVAPVRDEDGAVAGSVSVVEDLSDRRALEAQLRQSQKMETLGQLSGTIAHDFNNLLTAIRGFAEIAAATLGPDHEVADDIKEIRKASDRAAELTARLLAFSRQTPPVSSVVDLNSIVAGMGPILGRLLGPTVTLRISLGPNAGSVRIDRAQLEQAILNLAVNARDSMPGGGVITIATRGERVAGAPGAAAADPADPATSHVAVLTVEDTGVGMSTEVQQRAFEPFFTTKEAGEGTGLGLAIVFAAVRNADGDVTIESSPGHGSTFRITLPALEPLDATRAEAATDASRGGTESILLVEDEPPIRAFATRILTDRGYRVVVASDAKQAVELRPPDGERFDLLLTDVTMPGGSGPELVETLTGRDPQLRVLFMSGFVPGGRGPALPADARFLHKPFSVDELLRAVRAALDQVA
jgi:two-component system cell cycle sensor histidine kinase/response regulator CckA